MDPPKWINWQDRLKKIAYKDLIFIYLYIFNLWSFPGSSLVKNPPAMQEIPVQFLGWEDALENWIGSSLQHSWAFLVAQMVKSSPSMQETCIWSRGWENPLEEGMATHSSILAWRLPQIEEPDGLQSMGLQRVRHNWGIKHSTFDINRIHTLDSKGHVFWKWEDRKCISCKLTIRGMVY